MARIAVGGIQHETNVFAPYKAEYRVFERADEWPPLSRGRQMLDGVLGVHLPDGDGELLRRIRIAVGDSIPVVANWADYARVAKLNRRRMQAIAKQHRSL